MKYILKIKDLEIPFNIKEYKTAKTMKMYFKEDTLTVTKSPYIPKIELDRFIKRNEQIIYEEYKKMIEKKRAKKEKWQTGENIFYHGEKYTIYKEYHEKDIVRIKIEKEEKKFCIFLPKQIRKEEEEYYIIKTIKILFKENTEAILKEKLEYWSKKTNISYNNVKVRDAKTKYGSCNPTKKELHFTSRLVMLNDEAIDGIIVHELCHIVHPNHSRDFYKLVEKYIPNYFEIDKYLKKTKQIDSINV